MPAAWMRAAIEKAGEKALEPDFDSIAAIKSKEALSQEIVRLHREGADVLFGFDSGSDFKNASQIIAQVDQGGLGLPDRDYYFKDDQKSVELRKKYVEHVAKMFALLGDDQAKAAAEAKVVMEIETGLAKGALDQTTRRDPQKIYHKLSDRELAALSPAFNWDTYFRRRRRAAVRVAQRGGTGIHQEYAERDQRALARRLEDILALARGARATRRYCRRHSSTRTSISSTRRCRVPRNCVRAGNAA